MAAAIGGKEVHLKEVDGAKLGETEQDVVTTAAARPSAAKLGAWYERLAMQSELAGSASRGPLELDLV